MATNGCVAYDHSLQQEVLMMTVPLCLLADSPMAADFTNTLIPGSSNNPCRVCHLHCPQGDVRKHKDYGLRDKINFEIIELKNERYDEGSRIHKLIKEQPD